jgi:hypothetical protein
MNNNETFMDDNGNSITVMTADDGVTVQAHIVTLPPYTGGSHADAAWAYAKRHGLQKQ